MLIADDNDYDDDNNKHLTQDFDDYDMDLLLTSREKNDECDDEVIERDDMGSLSERIPDEA